MALRRLMSQVLPVDEWIREPIDKLLDYHDVLALALTYGVLLNFFTYLLTYLLTFMLTDETK